MFQPGAGGAEFDADVVPCNPASAPIWLVVDDDAVTVRFGEYVLGDFFLSRDVDALVDMVMQYFRAVLAGRYVEETWRSKGRITGGRGTFELDDERTLLIRTNRVLPFSFRPPQSVRYPAYTKCD